MLSEPFETKRMIFRLLSLCDAEVVRRQFSDPDMCRYFSEPPCGSKEAIDIIEHYQNPEGKSYLRYGMFDKVTGEFIGTCGYHYWDKELKQVEIGYDVWKDYWRQGYMSEALPMLINICFEHLGVNSIYVLTHPQNKASAACAKNFGFKESEPCRDTGAGQKSMKLLRKEWNK